MTEKKTAISSRTLKNGSVLGCGCLGLFAVPFAGVGIVMFLSTVYAIYEWRRVQAWEPTQAKIVEAELKVSRGSDSTTYRATATYEYRFEGNTYTSDRVSLSSMSDNIGSYQKDLGRRLEKHQRNGEPVQCFVDEQKPQNAILDRRLRFEMIAFMNAFSTVFGSVGLGLLLAAFAMRQEVGKKSALREKYPDEPWKWKPQWKDGTLHTNSARFIALSAVTLWWNLAAVPSCREAPCPILLWTADTSAAGPEAQ